MKILFCNPLPLTKELGGSKVTVELAEAMREIGWDCTVIGSNDILPDAGPFSPQWAELYSEALREYLQRHADQYDVVDYGHEYLPFTRSEFPSQTLFVARSVLLAHHLETIQVPKASDFKSRVGNLLKGKQRRKDRQWIVERAKKTVCEADLVNVSNHDDNAELVRSGILPDKIVVVPYGISESRRRLFGAVPSEPPEYPMVAFVGSFDYRKGAKDFPRIVREIARAVPEVRFRLLGTAGMFQTQAEVLAHFPTSLRPLIEVIPRYKSDQLPELLAPCSVGVFPSYMEGFGFGVLEMLAASVPVIAYDSPGPPMMLTPENLVPPGDAVALSAKVVSLLIDGEKLNGARAWAKLRAQEFTWERSASMTSVAYTQTLQYNQRTTRSLWVAQ